MYTFIKIDAYEEDTIADIFFILTAIAANFDCMDTLNSRPYPPSSG